MNQIDNPYLSIIIAGRNDNYGGDFISRLQSCIAWNTELLERYKVNTEFIIVNWNPIKENKSLKEQIEWTENRKYVKYRIITVPPEIHNTFNAPNIRKNVPLYEYLAKNTGIRRAFGQFILVLNPDILIDRNIIKKISRQTLQKGYYYRANRIDFIKDIQHPVKIWLKAFVYPIKNYNKLQIWFLKNYNKLRIWFHLNLVRFENYLYLIGWQFIKENAEFQYHCNSGDFILTHKSNFLSLNGFAENTYLSLHTDALFIVALGTNNLKEKIFSYPIYHKEHDRRYDAKNETERLYRKIYEYFQNEAQNMIEIQKPTIYNDKNWGLITFDLPEDMF